MSEQLKLGQIIDAPQHRDAIHIAVVPMTAAHTLHRGERVKAHNGNAVTALPDESIGVVDPFLRENVLQGQQFWLYLNPGSITSLRHEWTHPALDGSPDVVAAKALIARMADQMDMSYSGLMDYAVSHAKGWDDGYVVQQGHESWRDGFNAETFWPAYELVTGESVPEDRKDHFFSCSC
jgi:hypothetical protein